MDCDLDNQNESDDEGAWAVLRVVRCHILSPNIGSWEVDMRWQIVAADIVRDKDPDMR